MARADHGWWPYWLPLGSFLLIGEIKGRAPESWEPVFFALGVLVPAGLFLYFFLQRGAYPELRGFRPSVSELLQDVAVGVLGGLVWMAPYVWALRFEPPLWTSLPELLHPDPTAGFDAAIFGAGLSGLALGVRALGYAAVTPFVEELFVRSWLGRYAEIFDRGGDFRDVPIAAASLRSFVIVLLFFTLSHVPWEWPVAVLWVAGTQLWFYHRKQLGALVVVHAASNASILLAVLLFDGRIPGPGGEPIPLGFFV